MRRFLIIVLLFGLSLIFASTPPPTLAATTINVTTGSDEITVNGQCSLREAITLVNGGSAPDCGTLGTAPHTINLSGIFHYLYLSPKELSITTSDEIIIQGQGLEVSYILNAPSGNNRIFNIQNPNAHVAMYDLSISQGRSFAGAGILNEGSLALSRVYLFNNMPSNPTPSGQGGAILNRGTLTIEFSIFRYNRGSGGILWSEGSSTIHQSTFYQNGNASYSKVPVVIASGTTTIVNSTFAETTTEGNYVIQVNNGATLSLINSTIAHSHTQQEIYNEGNITITNTIVTNQLRPTSCNLTANGGVFTDGGGNLEYPGTNCGFSGALNDGTNDPLLHKLGNNGGPIFTMAPRIGSPIIDGTGSTCPPITNNVDSRNYTRDAICDIGAYETNPIHSTIQVTTTTDELITNSQCSLREAIMLINQVAAPDCGILGTPPYVISLPAGIYTTTIPTTWESGNLDGDFDILAHEEVTIQGAGSTNTFIQASSVAPLYPPSEGSNPGQADDRVFEVNEGRLNIIGVTVRNGFTNNTHPDPNGFGGGIYLFGKATLTTQDSTFTNNVSNEVGGAIFASGSFFIPNESEFVNALIYSENSNFSDNGASYAGSVIWSDDVDINQSTFTNNHVANNGSGAIHIAEGSQNNLSYFMIRNSNFTQNSTGGFGGAIFIDEFVDTGTSLLIANTTFENNSASQGGAIYNESLWGLSIKDNNLVQNSATERGGAVYGSVNNIENSNFIDNESLQYGGGIYIDHASFVPLDIIDSLFELNSAVNNGGAIMSDNGIEINIANSEFIQNSADNGSALFSMCCDTIAIRDSHFSQNTVSLIDGIGIAISIEESLFENNGPTDELLFPAPYDLNISNSTFQGNQTGIAWGVSTTVDSSTFVDNESAYWLLTAEDQLNIINSTITNNSVGFSVLITDSGSNLEIINTTIANNTVLSGTPSTIVNDGNVTVTNSILSNPAMPNCYQSGTGVFTDGGGNLEYPGTSCGFSGVLNDGTHDPLLQPLADNGGPTQTMALGAGSPAIDGTGATCPAEINGVDQRGEPRSPICDIGAYEYGSAEPMNDALVLFDPATSDTSYHFSVLDNPDKFDFTNTPPTNTAPVWVMGDWDGDGVKSPGYFDNGAFRYTNDIGPTTNWSKGWWFGFASTQVGIVSGRFDPVFNNDCFGLIDANVHGGTGDLRFSLKYWCNMTVRPQDPGGGPLLKQWHGSPLPDSGNFTGTHQWVYGDWDNDGLDEPAVRRGGFITRSENAPSEGAATYGTGAQRWDTADGDGPGAHGLNDGLFVAGDWNGDGVDTWGVVYDDDTFYYRDVFGWNPGPFAFSSQTFTSSIATPRQVDSHHNATGGSSAPGPASPVVVLAQEPTAIPTHIPATSTPVPTTMPTSTATHIPPSMTPAPTSTPISVGIAPTTTPVPSTDTPAPTMTSEPSLTPTPIVIDPTATDTPLPTATVIPDPVRLPVVEPMDDGAPHWLATGSWTLTEAASYNPDGLGWQATHTDDQSTLQFYAPIMLGNVAYPNLRFQSNLQATHSTAQVEISLDAQTWLVVGVIQPGEGWVEQSIDLRDYRSMTIYLRFNWVSSEVPTEQTSDWWLVDEVDLRNHPLEDPTATSEPVEATPTDSPSGGSIGTGGQPTAEPRAPTPVPGVTQVGIGH